MGWETADGLSWVGGKSIFDSTLACLAVVDCIYRCVYRVHMHLSVCLSCSYACRQIDGCVCVLCMELDGVVCSCMSAILEVHCVCTLYMESYEHYTWIMKNMPEFYSSEKTTGIDFEFSWKTPAIYNAQWRYHTCVHVYGCYRARASRACVRTRMSSFIVNPELKPTP